MKPPTTDNTSRSWLFDSLLARQVIAFLLSVVIPLLLFWLTEYNSRRTLDLQIAEERISQQGRIIDETFEGKLSSPLQHDLRLLAESPVLDSLFLSSQAERVLVLSDLEKLLQRTARGNEGIASLSFVNKDGKEEALVVEGKRSKSYKNLSEDTGQDSEWLSHAKRLFLRLREAPQLSISIEGPYQLAAGDTYLIAGIARLDTATGAFGGMLQITYRLEQFLSDLSSLSFSGVQDVWFFSKDGKVLRAPPERLADPTDLIKSLPDRQLQKEEGASFFRLALGLTQDEPVLFAVVSTPEEIFAQGARDTGRRFFWILIASTVASVLVALLFSRFLVSPLEKLSKATEEVAQGRLSRDVLQGNEGRPLPRELRALSQSFAALVEKLRQIPQGLKQAVSEMNLSMNDFRGATKEQYKAIELQASSLSEVSAITAQIEQVSKLTDEKMQSVLLITEQADDVSKRGQEAIEASVNSVESIKAQVDAIQARIFALAEGTAKAGEIIETVKDLADQTNILALNAAIQAAQAGESARGFDVVAREMRSLANQSSKSAVHIRDILSTTQDAIRSAVQMTKSGATEIEKSAQQIRASGGSLQGMTGIIQQSSAAARQIVAATNQQGAGIRQIYEAIRSLNTSMQGVLQGVKGTEGSITKMDGATQRVSEIVDSFTL